MKVKSVFEYRVLGGCLILSMLVLGGIPVVGQNVGTAKVVVTTKNPKAITAPMPVGTLPETGSSVAGKTTQSAGSYTVVANVKGFEDGAVMTLAVMNQSGIDRTIRDTVRNGMFRFVGMTDAPARVQLFGGIMPNACSFWVGPGTTTEITGEGLLPAAWVVESDLPEQIEANRYADACRDDLVAQQQCTAEITALGRVKSARRDSLFGVMVSLDRIIDRKELDILSSAPVSDVWMEKCMRHASKVFYNPQYPYRAEVVVLYERLDDSLKQSAIGRKIAELLYPPKAVTVGDKAPDGNLIDTTGTVRHLADFRSPGKYMLLDFWSVGCGPCRKAVPEMKEVARQYGDRLSIVGINLDSSLKVWKQVLADDGISWISLNDPQSFMGLAMRYGVKGIPHYVMVSPEGNVVSSWTGYGPEPGFFKANVEKILKPGAESATVSRK